MDCADRWLMLRRTLIALAVCTLLVLLGYFFIDRPVAFWVHDHGTNKIAPLKTITLAPPIVETWAPLIIALVAIRWSLGAVTKIEWTLFTAAVGLMVADEFRESISIIFGRDWPETWFNHNPSLIGNDAYGFNWFKGTNIYDSFPSGHMARTVAAAAVCWVAFPHLFVRSAGVAVSLIMAISLIGMNYHFVSDVIAGSFLGAIVGGYAAALGRLSPAAPLPEP